MLLLNGTMITPTIFPDNTSQVWHIPEEELHTCYTKRPLIEWRFSSESEFMHLVQLKTLLNSMGCNNPSLYLSYLPYGRQDREEVSNNTCFALVPFINLLRTLDFESIEVLDPHSTKLIESIATSVYPHNRLIETIASCHTDIICYPDKGAKNKYEKIYTQIKLPCIDASKVREESTGTIIKYELNSSDVDIREKNVLIVDDICDGGMTFIHLAKELYNKGALNVDLFVTHGIFSRGLYPLISAGIKSIHTYKGQAFEHSNTIVYRSKENE